jgi:UDP-GlcNAc:undecaprenyl-phosphate GlcNAc-1-phosphate transferase
MGDAGAYFIGYLLAIATMMATFAGGSAPRHAIFAPLCVLAVPLYDMLSVIVIRLRSGRSPFVGDTSHFSHRLVDLGLSKPQAVLTVHLTTAATGLGALLLHQVDGFGASVIGLMVAAQLTIIAILEATAHSRRSP